MQLIKYNNFDLEKSIKCFKRVNITKKVNIKYKLFFEDTFIESSIINWNVYEVNMFNNVYVNEKTKKTR